VLNTSEGEKPEAGAPEITVDFSERSLVEAAHGIRLVSGCHVSLGDYVAAAV
jgi:hypothetical protein